MKKPQRDFYTDIIAFVLFLGLITTGTILAFLLPPGSGSLGLWGLTRHEWGDVHFWIAAGFLTVIALHVVFHFRWIMTLIRGRASESRNRRTLASGVILVVMLVLAAGVLLGPREPVDRGGEQHGRQRHAESVTRPH